MDASKVHVLMHPCLSVRGALKTMNKRQLGGMFRHPTGRRMTADEAKDVLLDQLSKGREVIPFGPPCEGFSYIDGCPGHAAPEGGQ